MKAVYSTMVKESFWDFKGETDYIDEWFLMRTPIPVTIIIISYLLFVLKIGPEYMKNRKPYNLNNVLFVYNFAQILFSYYLFDYGARFLWNIGLLESKCVINNEEIKYTIACGHYFYFIAKATELLDTVFFVLRKKWNQITFLHVYHHTLMFLSTWITLKYAITFSLLFLGTLNSFVHVIMYAYYGLSAFPGLEKYLWWKKHITKMQLVQFLIVITQININTVVSECPLSYFMLILCWFHTLLFIYLFLDFYFKSYRQRKSSRSEIKTKRSLL